jgi:predicted transcriptional regulator
MKIRFKSQEDIIISEEIKQSVLEGLKDAEEGRLVSSEEVRKKAATLCSK